MSRSVLSSFLPHARAERRARRALAQELADYTSPTELNDLSLLVEAGRAEVATLLRGQAHRQLFRAG